ncbi:MAG: right-handed parallel beta-helix repeat-containing protein [Acidobacteriia bacterium]|nr:right-handed parallel beta-helix repeat-containing protein [Terriglobia bacterium]
MLNIKILKINVRRNAWLLLAILGIASVAVALPHPPSLACGDRIQTSVKLTHDLGPCPDDGIHIVAATPVTLDLNGHKIIGQGSGTGVTMFGDSIIVKGPGRIVNFGIGINLDHGTDHVMIYDLNLVRNIEGIFLDANNVRVLDNTIDGRDRGTTGISIFGPGHYVYRNIIRGHSDFGLLLGRANPVVSQNVITENHVGIHFGREGSYTIRGNIIFRNETNGIEAEVTDVGSCGTIEDNFLRANGGNGVLVTGSHSLHAACVVRDNIVQDNRLNGISIAGANDHIVIGNRASNNGVDLQWDGVAGACWSQNIFSTSSPETLPQCPPF